MVDGFDREIQAVWASRQLNFVNAKKMEVEAYVSSLELYKKRNLATVQVLSEAGKL